jgi:hypothetical protein
MKPLRQLVVVWHTSLLLAFLDSGTPPVKQQDYCDNEQNSGNQTRQAEASVERNKKLVWKHTISEMPAAFSLPDNIANAHIPD